MFNFNGKIHYKWTCSIAMLNYQSVLKHWKSYFTKVAHYSNYISIDQNPTICSLELVKTQISAALKSQQCASPKFVDLVSYIK